METKSVTIAKFPFNIIEGHESVILSPLSKHLLRITLDRKIFLYSLLNINQDEKTASLIWHDPSLFISSCMFSQDEKQFVTISKEKTFLFISLDEAGLFEEDEVQISDLQKLFNALEIDLITSLLELISVSEHRVVLLINNSRLVSFEWESPGHIHVDYCVKVTGSVVSVSTVKNKAFCLTNGGEILIYNIHDGILDNVFNIHMALPNVSVYTGICINQNVSRAALLDRDNVVYILDISVTSSNETAASVGQDESSQDGSESVASFQTSTSIGSTYSRIGSVRSSTSWKQIPTIMSCSSNSLWMLYLDKLKNKVISDRELDTSTPFVCIRDIPHDLSVQHMRFLHGNLRIWCRCSNTTTNGLYRLYNINTGETELSEPLNSTTQIVPVDCPGISLDLLFQGSHLTVPLGSLSKEDFVYKILHCIGSDCLEQVLQVDDSLAESMQPLPLLQDAIVNGQVDLVRLSLNLHAQGFKSKLTHGYDVTGETEQIMGAMTVVVIQDGGSKVQFNKEVQRLALSHANTLLALLQETEPVRQQIKHELEVKIMMYVVKLREGLFKSDTTHADKESFSSEWLEWEQLSNRDIVKTSVSRLPVVHWYLHQQRQWSSKDIKGQKFKELIINLVMEMLEDKQLDEAKIFLRQAGYQANEELQTLCANSLNSAFRDYLVISMYDIMETKYTEAWKFVKLLEDVLERNSSALTEGKADIVQRLPMSICDSMRLSAESKAQIITDLYFNTWDSILVDKLDKDIVWEYLFYQNCVEGLMVWLGQKTDTELTLPWPVELFAKWDITSEMIDRIPNFDCANYTKDVVLDYLAVQGQFTSTEKNSVQAVMKRLAHTKNITNYESILNRSGSSISCTEFYYNLLQHAVDNDLVHLVINVIPHSLMINCKTDLTERCSWLNLWKLYCQVSNTWTKEETLTVIIETAKYLSSGDMASYLEKHPLVAVMISLLQDNEIPRDLCSISPLLEATIETEPKSDDVTVYSLLSGTTPFNADNLFQFQNQQKRNTLEGSTTSTFPTFSDPELCKQYGRKQTLEYTNYLKQGRPSVAVMYFCSKQANTYGHISKRMKKRACNVAHGLAVQHFANTIVTSSCIAFMEMLGRDSAALRTHLVAANLLQAHKADMGFDEHYLTHLLHNMIIGKPPDAGTELLKQVEKCHLLDWREESSVAKCLQQFYLEIKLANMHNLPFPLTLFKYTSSRNDWLMFLLAAQLFQLSQNQVQQLLKGLNSPTLREHLSNALRVNVTDEEKTDIQYLKNTGVLIPKENGAIPYHTEEDLFGIIAKCSGNAEVMLELSRTLGNPPLALLAVCTKPDLIIPAFATWLVTSLPQESFAEYPSAPWTAEKVTVLLEIVVKTRYFHTLAHAFLIFFPNNPLYAFANFLVQSIVDKRITDSIMNLKLFKATCINLPDEEIETEDSFISNKKWIATTAMRVTCTALAHCFPSLYHQNCFLKVLCQTQFADLLPVTVPDMCFLFQLAEFMTKRNYTLDYSRLWIHNDTKQLNEYLAILVDKQDFEAAFEFASIANLPVDTVHLAQCKVRANSDEANSEAFWNHCNSALQDAKVQPSLAVEFFRHHATCLAVPQIRYVVLKYTIEWIKKMPESEVDQYLLHMLKMDLYQCALSDGFDIEMVTERVESVVLKYLRKDLINDAAVKFLDSAPHPTLSAVQRHRLDDLIYRLLEVGDLATTCNLQFMFKHRNQDCELILTCMSLAEGDMKPHRLPDTVQDIINKESTPPLYFKPKLPVSSPMAVHLLPSQQIEQQSVLDMLYLLKAYQTSPTAIFDRIICAYKVACALNIHYKDVIVHEDPLSLLHREDDFEMAQCIFTLANLSQVKLAEYIATQVISVIAAGPAVNGSYFLWQCNLDSDFSRFVNSAGLPVLLGNLLMAAVPKFDSLQTKSHRDAVELLTRAHECYTKSCNMEGIATVLTMSRTLVSILNSCCQWALMVRLLVGVGRYAEMTYIFQILKENEQFEFLLGKGLDKYPGLMSALMEFVRNDKGLFSLVALHFHMYADLAVLFEMEAKTELKKLEKGQDNTIVCTEHNKLLLQVAMDSYAHATEHYMQAKKLKRAVSTIQQAELVALQLSFMTATPLSQTTHCLLNLTETQAVTLINRFLSYDQACIVERAYDLVIDWSTALYHHCVLLGSTAYLNAWCQHHQLTSTIVQEVARRFQMEGSMTSTVETNMKWFVSSITYVDVKYRVASQLGFKDILQSLLSGPDVAYLKDTVWQSGCKRVSI